MASIDQVLECEIKIQKYDFYDEILFKYYGKKYVSEDEADEPNKRCIVEMYVWKDNFYISEVKYE